MKDIQTFGRVKQSIMRNTTLSLETKSIYAYLSTFVDNESRGGIFRNHCIGIKYLKKPFL